MAKFKGVFRSIDVSQITYTLEPRPQFSFDLPEMTVYMGPEGATSSTDEGVVALVTIPPKAAPRNGIGITPVSEESRSKLSDLLQELELSLLVFAEPTVKKGQPLPPSGAATMKIIISVHFTADTQDVL